MKITIKEIVGQFLNSADQSSHQFMRLYNMAVWGLKTEFNLDITGEIQTVVLDMNANKTVNLPHDYIAYSKIGVVNSNGEIATFRRNDKLSLLNSFDTEEACRNTTAPQSNGGGLNYVYGNNNYFNYWNNGTSYQLFGLDSGVSQLGEYRLDETNKLILFNHDCTYSSIVLEFLSDGYDSDCDDYSVDIRAAEAMVCYLRWYDAKDQRKKFSQGDVRIYKKEFYNQKRLAKMRLNPFRVPEMLDAHIRSIKLTAKS